jgi:TolA-binding protein
MTTEGQVVLTVAELDRQEQELIARRDSYVNQANSQIAMFNGAIQQVQHQRTLIQEKQKGQEKAKNKRRGKPARKETPVAPEPPVEGA